MIEIIDTTTMKIEELKKGKAQYNPRIMEPENMARLMNSLKKYGQMGNLIWNRRTKTLVSGHQRTDAGENLGWKVMRVDIIDVDEPTERALNITLNNPKMQGEWDNAKLLENMDFIIKLDSPDIKLEDTGFNQIEYEEIRLSVEDSSGAHDDVSFKHGSGIIKTLIIHDEEREREILERYIKWVKERFPGETISKAIYMDILERKILNDD